MSKDCDERLLPTNGFFRSLYDSWRTGATNISPRKYSPFSLRSEPASNIFQPPSKLRQLMNLVEDNQLHREQISGVVAEAWDYIKARELWRAAFVYGLYVNMSGTGTHIIVDLILWLKTPSPRRVISLMCRVTFQPSLVLAIHTLTRRVKERTIQQRSS